MGSREVKQDGREGEYQRRSKKDIEAEIAELKKELEEDKNGGSSLTEMVKGFGEGVFVEGDIEKCAEIARGLKSDELYLSLYDAFLESRENRFDNYLWGMGWEMQKISEQSGSEEVAEFGEMVGEIHAQYCQRNPQYYTLEIEKVIKQTKKTGTFGKEEEGLYAKLGLDGSKMRRPAELFIELALRRELTNHDWKDGMQEFTSEHFTVLPNQSIGPLEIKPDTYLRALLVKEGFRTKKTYKDNLETAITGGVIQTEGQLIYRIMHIITAIKAFEDIVAMYMPAGNTAVKVFLNKGGALKEYTIPIRDRYTFSTREGRHINFSYEELRLMAALASYQGKGLRFLSPDKEVQVAGNEVVLEEKLVLNNVVTEICVA